MRRWPENTGWWVAVGIAAILWGQAPLWWLRVAAVLGGCIVLSIIVSKKAVLAKRDRKIKRAQMIGVCILTLALPGFTAWHLWPLVVAVPAPPPLPPAPTVPPRRTAPQRVPPELFYDDYDQRSPPLKDAQVTLESRPQPGSLRCWPHVWADMPNIEPNWFSLCGIWMKKPPNAADLTGFGARYVLYVDLSQPVKQDNRSCPQASEKPDPPYVVTLMCDGIMKDEPTRWVLYYVNATPIPQANMKVRIRFEYPKGGRAEATFTVRPPKLEPTS